MTKQTTQDLQIAFVFEGDALTSVEVKCGSTKSIFHKGLSEPIDSEKSIEPDKSAPDTYPYTHELLECFGYEQLPERLQTVSKPFHDLAHELSTMVKPGFQRNWALQYLLIAKDAAVRAALVATIAYLPTVLPYMDGI